MAAAELSGRWQIPLMVVALTLLGVSVWRLRPQPKPPSFDQLFAQAAALKEAGLHEEASKAAEALLADPARTPQERVKLHRLLAEVIFAYESGNAVHGPANCRRIIENSDKSLLAGEEFEADAHHMRGLAREWLGQTGEAVVEYRQALAKGVKDPWAARQHVIELRRLDKSITTEQLHEELEAFMSGADVPRELQFWAAEQKIKSYAATGRHDQAEKFLADHSRLFEDSRWKNGYDYLRALVGYHVGRHDEAERLLRSLRERVVPGDPLYAQTGWLLGSILEQQGAPEYALSLFIEVLDKTVPSPSRTACLFGRAECLAETERFAESLKTFEEVIRLSTENPLIAQVDLKDVRESVTAWYQTLYLTGNRERAMAYLKLAARLAPPSDASMQAIYAKRVADLAMELGRAALVRAAEGKTDADSHRQTAHKYLTQAGEEYLRLAKLEGVDIQGTTAAMWQAAETLDLAGERTRMVGVLERFIAAYPEDTRVPEALLQLGRAFQTAGDITRAVEKYQENLIRYPRTPAALASLIPLADCFEELKQKDKAEQTLLRVVTPRPGDALALITPEAPEYQDALFRLGDLYMAEEEYEKAIGRYEEALERYAGDPRADSATFHLADAYRKSAARIRRDLEDPKNIAFRESLQAMHQQRLQRAHEMFDREIERYRARPEASLSDLDRLRLKLSHLYTADAVYDQSLIPGAAGGDPFARSLSMYEKAAWIYQRDPIAMSAYVQIINCYLRLSKVPQAWMALQRARWALRNIPAETFVLDSPDQDRAFWENYLNWLEKKPMFAPVAMATGSGEVRK